MWRSFWMTKLRTHCRQIKLKRARLIRRLTLLSRAAARCARDAWCQPNWRSGVDAVQRQSCLNLVRVAPRRTPHVLFTTPLESPLAVLHSNASRSRHFIYSCVCILFVCSHCDVCALCSSSILRHDIFLGDQQRSILSYLVFTFRWNVERNSSRSVSENKQYIGIESFVSAVSFPEDGYSLY